MSDVRDCGQNSKSRRVLNGTKILGGAGMGLYWTVLKGTLGSILKVTFMKKLFNYNSTVIDKVGTNPSFIKSITFI